MEIIALIREEFRKMFTHEIAVTIGVVLGVIFGGIILTIVIQKFVLEKDEAGLSQLDYLFGAESDFVPITQYSVQQAHLVCTIEIRKKMGSVLQTMTYDSRSSRYNPRRQMFKVFYDITFENDKGKSEESWAYCDVSATTGKLDEIRLKTEGKGLFGF